jgi:hypothetical protein
MMCGLMALAVDADHIPSASESEVQGRMSHSIPFTIIPSVLVGTVTTLILNSSIRQNAKPLATRASGSHVPPDILVWSTFSQFLVITAAAVISHIAYDTFVDNHANFPLFVPFVYADFISLKLMDSQSRGLRFYLDACGIDLLKGMRRQIEYLCSRIGFMLSKTLQLITSNV